MRDAFRLVVFVFGFAFLLCPNINAAAVLDRTFGNNGKVTTLATGQNDLINILFQSDNKIVAVVGTDYSSTVLIRYSTAGTLDGTFGTAGFLTLASTSNRIVVSAIQPDGKFLLAGGTGTPNSDLLIIRLLSTGTLDPTFGTNGVVTFNQGQADFVNAVALQSDGKIVAAGGTDSSGQQAVFRLNANGSLDTSFGNAGFYSFAFPQITGATFSGLSDIKVVSGGRLLTGAFYWRHVSGAITDTNGYDLLMLDANGVPDPAFGSQGFAHDERNSDYSSYSTINFEQMPSGNIFVAYSYGGVALLGSTGTKIRDLPFEGYQTRLMANGKVLVSGDAFYDAAKVGSIKPYSERNIIGKAAGYGRGFPAPDGTIVTADLDPITGQLTLSRTLRLSSQGTRSADFDRDDKTDPAILRQGMISIHKSTGGALFNFLLHDPCTVIPELFETSSAPNRRDMITYAVRGVADTSGSYFEGKVVALPGSTWGLGQWGIAGDIPVGGDFDGNGSHDVTVFRPSDGNWYSLYGDGGNPRYIHWGMQGDKPVPADYDYDGITDFAIYRPSTGVWWIYRSSDQSVYAIQFGIATDIPVPGDFDGDGYADFTVYRPSEGLWYQWLTGSGFNVVRFGLAADIPVPGDYDGDGITDIAVWRPSNGYWYMLDSQNGFSYLFWGANGDTPITTRYDQ